MPGRVTRRTFLAGVGAGAVVAGFDPLTRGWISQARAAECPGFADVPELDGTLHFDDASRDTDSRDMGNMVFRRPCAVLRPGSVADVQKMVRYCREHAIEVATRGQGHTTFGQALVSGGLVIENAALRAIHSIGPEGADVDAGVTWRELLEAAAARGIAVPAVTGYTKLSVAGTLSVGGVGAQTTNTTGLQIDHVRELEVVTGKGDLVRCSAAKQSDLFDAMLGGLGQCGVITRARVDLVPLRERARVYTFNYPAASSAAFFRDLRTLLYRGELDSVYSVCFPFGTALAYQLTAVSFFDPGSPPDDARLMRGLTVPAAVVGKRDSSYLEYLFLIDDVFDAYRAGGFDGLVKPWYDVWLPESIVEPYVSEIVAGLGPLDVGPTGFVLVLPQLRGSITKPFYRVPDVPTGEFVYLFDVLTSSVAPGEDPGFAAQMLARNRRWYDVARAAGGTRYLIGSLEFSAADWRDHYGSQWSRFSKLKKRYDPDGILAPGLGIF